MSHSDLLAAALRYVAGGLSIIPIGTNKKPCAPLLPTDPATGKATWKPFQTQAADETKVRAWLADSRVTGVAVVCGNISGGLLIIDFDVPRLYEAWNLAVGPLAEDLPTQKTGRGYQVALRCEDPGSNVVLAWVPDEEAEAGRSAGIETRGEGGYAILPGSQHPNGKVYTAVAGDFAAIPTIPMERVRLLLSAARNLCEAPFSRKEMERAKKAKPKVRKTGRPGTGVIQQWNEKIPIREMLVRAGYIPFGDRFTRPGSDAMPGGVVVFDESGRSFHHSSNDQLHDGHAHDSFSVFCETQHGGDVKEAVKAAAAELGLEGGTSDAEGAPQPGSGEERKRSQASNLVEMVEESPGIELFHTPGGVDSEGYATIKVGEHRETWAINSKAFKRWLSRMYFVACDTTPNSQAIADAINVLAGNLPRDEQWVLVVAWLVAALRPGLPIPIQNVNGEQGSAKSTLCRMSRGLIDPNKAPLRSPPREERDLAIAAGNSLVVAYDNLSGLPPALSDALCRLATGGGFGTRELFSNDDEKLFDYLRPVLINGIDDVATRPDALERCLNITLDAISDGQRRDESELWAEYERRRPRILGGLLTAVSSGLRNIATTKFAKKPRMADFALWVAAAEPALPWNSGKFMEVYAGNRDEAHTLAIEASAVGLPILALMNKKQRWVGTSGELLLELATNHADDATRKRKDWPANRKAMANALRRIAPNLRARGVAVTLPSKGVGHDKKRIFVLEQVGGTRSASSAQSATPPIDPGNEGWADSGADHTDETADHAQNGRSADTGPPSPPGGPETPPADRADRADHGSPTRSKGGPTNRSLADGPCFTCKRREWWRLPDKPGGWTCGNCHAPVEGLQVVWASDSGELEIRL